MKQIFKYTLDIEKSMRLKFEAAQELTIQRLIDEILYPEFIQKRIYDRDESPYYDRTFVLLDIFQAVNVYHRGNDIFGGIETSSESFMAKQNADKWQNQSKLDSEPPISATDFVNIINNGVSDEHSVFGEQPPTRFWEDFINYVSMGEYRKIFYEELKKLTGVEIKELSGNSITERNSKGTIFIKARRPRFFKDQESKTTAQGRARRRANAAERRRINKARK